MTVPRAYFVTYIVYVKCIRFGKFEINSVWPSTVFRSMVGKIGKPWSIFWVELGASQSHPIWNGDI